MLARPPGIDPDWLELEFVVPREQAGWRVDYFIAYRIPRLSRTRIQRILRKAGFDRNNRPLKSNHRLAPGELIRLFRPLPDEPEVPRDFAILYEDDWLLAVDKPSGLPVHPTARYHRNTLTALLGEQFGTNRPILTHRLDSETSGVVLTAKTKAVESAVKKMFAARQIRKLYHAVVQGTPQPATGRIDVPLGPDEFSPIRVKMAPRADGLPALTEYSLVRELRSKGISLVRCHPRTGRQHQIRAHLAHIGHPVVGDKMYGLDSSLFLDYVECGPTPEIIARAGFARQALHATALCLVHPVTEKEQEITSPLPADIQSLLAE